jgi:hypothetical protein
VRCVRLPEGADPASPGLLELGRDYVVLSIEIVPGAADASVFVQILHEELREGGFDWGYWDFELFEIISPTIPSNWVVAKGVGGRLILGPQAWRRPWHWDALDRPELDSNRRAWKEYETERDEIVAQSTDIASSRKPLRYEVEWIRWLLHRGLPFWELERGWTEEAATRLSACMDELLRRLDDPEPLRDDEKPAELAALPNELGVSGGELYAHVLALGALLSATT